MKLTLPRWLPAVALLFVLTLRCPAPLIYTPGEGWTYEPAGAQGKWQRTRAKDQLEVAQAAFDKKDYSTAIKACARVIKVWSLSDYAPPAEFLLARCYEAKKQDEKAFNEYERLLDKHPKSINYDDAMRRMFEICNRFLNGQWFKLWGVIPTPPSMDKTAGLFERVVKHGPYSEIGVQAQMSIGAAHEKQLRLFGDQEPYIEAARAYELASDRYHDHPKVAADALYKAGLAYRKQAQSAEYDQGTAGQAIATFTDFITLYPGDDRVKEAQKIIAELGAEQARGNFAIAKFYENSHMLKRVQAWKGALVYYNAVVSKAPDSPLVPAAIKRIEELKALIAKSGK